jgi:hypothetical protein
MTPLYVRRRATDTNLGRIAHRDCPCIVLMALFDDETFDGWRLRHLLCPSCAAGWVREEPYEESADSSPSAGSEATSSG